MASRDIPVPVPKSPEEILDRLKQKFHPVFMNMETRHVKVHEVGLDNNRLYIRAEARSPEDRNYIFDEIRMIDPELEEVSADIEVSGGAPRTPSR